MSQYKVYLYDSLVGYLIQLPNDKIVFEFSSEYHKLNPRPILGQFFEDDLYKTYKASKRKSLPNFFDNLLPEGALKEKLIYLHDLNEYEPVEILSVLGKDLPGAVTISNEEQENSVKPKEDATQFLEIEEEITEHNAIEGLRFSLAGVQLKFSLVKKEKKWTLPMKGHTGQWIIKLAHPDFYSNVVENEYVTMNWAKESGFEIPDFELLEYGDIKDLPIDFLHEKSLVFAINRYDRKEEKRLHQEDFAQVTNVASKHKYGYISYDDLTRLSFFILGIEGLKEFLRRLLFVFISGNFDAHLKNWSLLYLQKSKKDTSTPHWSPIYDQVSTVMWPDLSKELALNFMKTRRLYSVNDEVMKKFYEKLIIDISKIVPIDLKPIDLLEMQHQTVTKIINAWDIVKETELCNSKYRNSINEHWKRVPFLKRYGELA